MHTDQGRYDKPLAWLLALGLQGLLLALLWWLPPPAAERITPSIHDTTRIRLSWRPRPVVVASPAPARPRSPPLSKQTPRRANAAPAATKAPPGARPALAPPATGSPAFDYSAGATEWTRQPSGPSLFAPDPLGNRPPRLPGGQAPERFRMKSPRSVKAVLDGIGELFGGAGYAHGPCPNIRRQVQAWKTDTSERGRARLAHELERERRYCRR